MTTIEAAECIDGPRLLAYLCRVCRESGVTFEPLLNQDEERAGLACAHTFLKECREAGTDPRQLLHRAVINWGRFRRELRTADGREVFLPPAVSFLHFFRFRGEIMAWLEACRE